MRPSPSQISSDLTCPRFGGAAGILLSKRLIGTIGLRAPLLRTLLLIGP
jgi:hypothetical protein